MRFAPEAFGVIVPVFLIGALLFIWGVLAKSTWMLTAASGVVVLSFGLLIFFRNPLRVAPPGDDFAVAPADGVVIVCESLPDGRKHVAVFLSIFDVHVNRTPVTGQVCSVRTTKGSHHHAGSDEANSSNERVDVEADTPFGAVSWRQVAGMLARKISCRLKPGDKFTRGSPFGLIYFGSRMDVFLPSSAELLTVVGQRVKAGESIIARLSRKGKE
jgi:phosphatidylserine decarboxylase